MRRGIGLVFVVMMLAGCPRGPKGDGLALPPADTRPVLNVRDFGATGDGKTKDTLALQKGLDACAAAGGGRLRIPAGNYFTGSLVVPSNTTLLLEKDAAILGTPDLADYPIIKARWEGHWVDAHRALVSAQDASHIAIRGPGRIVGNPALGGRQMPRRPCVIEPIHCTDIRFDGFSVQQQLMWAIHPTDCQEMQISNLTIRTTGGNGDGIDIDSCRHVNIMGCDIDTGDDCIAIKSGRGMEGYREAKPSEGIFISHCTLGDSNFACIGIGSETSGGIRGVTIDHCTFTHAKSFAIYIKSHTDRGAYIEDIKASDLEVVSATGGFLRINLMTSGIADAEPVAGNEGIPTAKNYSFSDVRIAACGTLVDAALLSPVKPLDGLTISNVTGACQKGMTLANVTHAAVSGVKVTGFTGALMTKTNVTGVGVE